MDSLMFAVTFALGAIVVLVAVIALFKKKSAGGSGSLEFGGFKLAGTGAPSVFLLTGVVLMLSGVNGYAAIERNRSLQTENKTLATNNESLTDSVTAVRSNLAVERARTKILLTKIPPQTLQTLQIQHKDLFSPPMLHNPSAFTPVTPGGTNP